MTSSLVEAQKIFGTSSTVAVARYLVGMYLEHRLPDDSKLGGWIVDCEAYLGPEDEAAHSYGMRQTPRVRAMYQEPGTIYLYQMHTHLILNMVTQPAGQPQGVMIRGLEPDPASLAQMSGNRGGKTGAAISDGPGKLIKALGVTPDFYGQSIFSSDLHICPEKKRQPRKILELPRIGIPNKGKWTQLPLRFVCEGNPYVTKQKKADVAADHGWQ